MKFICSLLKKTPLIFLWLMIFILTGCFKDFKEDYLFLDNMVEFDVSTWESPAPGKKYPILDPVTKGSGIHKFKVNLLGKQFAESVSLQYKIVEEETTAEKDKHFRLKDEGTFTIEANSSFGEVSIEILDFIPESGVDTLVLELVESNGIKVSENYKRIGIAISLTGPPSQDHSLYQQLGEDSYYNSIYFDMFNPNIPTDIKNRMNQAATNLESYLDGSRRLQGMYVHFGDNDEVTVIAFYYGGGGNSLTASPIAGWTYKLEFDNDGVGKFIYVEAYNSNGENTKSLFDPILTDYLEKYEFKIDWVSEDISSPAKEGDLLGGIFRKDESSSFILGSLETLKVNGSVKPYPNSSALHDIFDNAEGGYYSTLLINPEDPDQSQKFKDRWDAGKSYIEGLAGRQLHRIMFYYNPDFNFQDVRLVTYYYTATGGKVIGQIRFTHHMDFDGIRQPLEFIFQNANGNATRAPEIVDDFLMSESFKMEREGDVVKFVNENDPAEYFYGELGNNQIGTSAYWPE